MSTSDDRLRSMIASEVEKQSVQLAGRFIALTELHRNRHANDAHARSLLDGLIATFRLYTLSFAPDQTDHPFMQVFAQALAPAPKLVHVPAPTAVSAPKKPLAAPRQHRADPESTGSTRQFCEPHAPSAPTPAAPSAPPKQTIKLPAMTPDQVEYVQKIETQTARAYDPNTLIGNLGPRPPKPAKPVVKTVQEQVRDLHLREPLLTRKQLAEKLKCSRPTVDLAVKRFQLSILTKPFADSLPAIFNPVTVRRVKPEPSPHAIPVVIPPKTPRLAPYLAKVYETALNAIAQQPDLTQGQLSFRTGINAIYIGQCMKHARVIKDERVAVYDRHPNRYRKGPKPQPRQISTAGLPITTVVATPTPRHILEPTPAPVPEPPRQTAPAAPRPSPITSPPVSATPPAFARPTARPAVVAMFQLTAEEERVVAHHALAPDLSPRELAEGLALPVGTVAYALKKAKGLNDPRLTPRAA